MANKDMFKVGVALGFIGGSCLVLLGIMAFSASNPTLNSSNAAASTSLFGLTASLRKPSSMLPQTLSNRLPGSGPWKDLALASMESANSCNRDISTNAMSGINTVMAKLSSADRDMVTSAVVRVRAQAADMIDKVNPSEFLKAGQVAPLGYFDPAGITTGNGGISKGRLLFYREAEIKHGRLCMLAVLGTLVGETFHPLLGGTDVAGVTHFQTLPEDPNLDTFWKFAFLQNIIAISAIELKYSLTTIGVPEGAGYKDMNSGREGWDDQGVGGRAPQNGEAYSMATSDRIPGDFGFDPLGLRPKTAPEFLEVQNKEILNGRLAMIAAAGIIGQEQFTGEEVFR